MRYISLALFLVWISNWAMAQSNCSQQLSDAVRLYESGRLQEIPDKVSPCLRGGGLSKEELAQAYRLLTLVYLYEDDRPKAEEAYISLLGVNKEYQPNEEFDPRRLVNLAKSFRTRPILSGGFKVGSSVTMVNTINYRSMDNDLTNTENWFLTPGVNAAFAVYVPLLKNLEIGGEIQYSGNRIQSTTSQLWSFAEVNYSENLNYANIPVHVDYGFTLGRYSPYAYAGYSYGILLNSSISAERLNGQESSVTGSSFSGNTLRRRGNQSLLGGIGVKYKTPWLGIFMLEARYMHGLNNITESANVYNDADASSNEIRYRYGYVPSDISINSLSFTVGLLYPIYKPKKVN
ncbi:porin family protein [Cytophagales bacterium LB-30]|uniref:Porin family protein n=1 Tax=Shiella aurantiaca TaxID=3058365 RepID=A0ABT8F4L9_9BACT|nr:porin family protein [Shiella aurantiaca]MDN4165400.1 porin family protein [Shiella aurantiaca]